MRSPVFMLILALACQGKTNHSILSESSSSHLSQIKYAVGFTIENGITYTKITIKDPWQGSREKLEYILYQTEKPDLSGSYIFIKIPISSLACTSTSHIPHLDYLHSTHKLIGFTNPELVSSTKARARIDSGKVTGFGQARSIDVEQLLELNPALVMAYGYNNGAEDYKLIQKAGIPVVFNADYLEENPLGRAEWIKFTACFLGKEKQADSIFNFIEKEYLKWKSRIIDIERKPTVFSGSMWGDSWYVPGGRSYAAKFFEDAGGLYLWAENENKGSLNLGYENVFVKAQSADFWIGIGMFKNKHALLESDQRYQHFNALKSGKVFNYTKKIGPTGGLEVMELGYLRPDLILADMIKILHPEKAEDHKFLFYQRLD